MKRGRRNAKWDFFDDCAVCEAMRIAEKRGRDLTMQELMEAFAKANAQNPLPQENEEMQQD